MTTNHAYLAEKGSKVSTLTRTIEKSQDNNDVKKMTMKKCDHGNEIECSINGHHPGVDVQGMAITSLCIDDQVNN